MCHITVSVLLIPHMDLLRRDPNKLTPSPIHSIGGELHINDNSERGHPREAQEI